MCKGNIIESNLLKISVLAISFSIIEFVWVTISFREIYIYCCTINSITKNNINVIINIIKPY
jgi:hypothetical protein